MVFDLQFIILLLIGAAGGALLALVRSVASYERNESKWSLVVLWFLRDIAVGAGLGFTSWLATKLVTNVYATSLTTFILSLAGVAGFEGYFQRENLKNALRNISGAIVQENRELAFTLAAIPEKDQKIEKLESQLYQEQQRNFLLERENADLRKLIYEMDNNGQENRLEE